MRSSFFLFCFFFVPISPLTMLCSANNNIAVVVPSCICIFASFLAVVVVVVALRDVMHPNTCGQEHMKKSAFAGDEEKTEQTKKTACAFPLI